MTSFGQAVEEAQSWLGTAFAEAPAGLRDAMMHGSIREHAGPVGDCVARFARAELEGKALGRYGPVKVFPALGDHQAKQLRDADPGQREQVREAILFGVAVGYTFMAATEEDGQPDPDRRSEEIWNVWVPNLNSGLIEKIALPSDMLSDLRQMGASSFQERALELGLGGFGKKARLGHSGAFYAQGGALLRAVQLHQDELKPEATNIWPYGEHPA